MDTFTYEWLLALGFPPALAAAIVAPEIFRDDDRSDSPACDA